MASLFTRYTHWLHTRWPAGTVEKLPACDEHGRTNLPGVRIVGDLTGVPLLKFSSDSGARAVREIAAELGEPETRNQKPETLDLAIIGGGVAGISAAIEARRAGLNFAVFEATQVFSTVANFPKAKPIFTYPTDMQLDGGLHFTADVKEALLAEMEAQRRAAGIEVTPARIERLARDGETLVLKGADGDVARARRVIVAIGRSGNHRKLGVPGESELVGKGVSYCATCDAAFFKGVPVAVVGGGDAALDEAMFAARFASTVTVIHRRDTLRASAILQQRARNTPNIHFLWDTVVERINGDAALTSLTIRNVRTEAIRDLDVAAVFVAIGQTPNSGLLNGLVPLDSGGHAHVNLWMETPVPGLYVAGDVRADAAKQLVTAAGDGVTAAIRADAYLAVLPTSPGTS